jgi:hypothetical protein
MKTIWCATADIHLTVTTIRVEYIIRAITLMEAGNKFIALVEQEYGQVDVSIIEIN